MNEAEHEIGLLRPHFDAIYYRREYPDVVVSEGEQPAEALLAHFCRAGWREGRNPSAAFDTVAYLDANPLVAASLVNPLLHACQASAPRSAGTLPWPPAIGPSLATLRLFGRPITDWVERLRPHVDPAFYERALGETQPALRGVDLVAHFAYRGWREGLSPSTGFDTRAWLATHPEMVAAQVNPLLAALEGRYASRPDIRPGDSVVEDRAAEEDDAAARRRVAAAFAPAFYLRACPAVSASGLDPLEHYLAIGWRQGLRPTPSFDTAYYLAANPDVAAAGINPFWHYVVNGEREGRLPAAPGGPWRRVVDAARAPEPPAGAANGALIEEGHGPSGLAGRIAAASGGIVLSLSHDRYTVSVGGSQIVVADEQRKFNQKGWTYVHLAPARPALFVSEDFAGVQVWVTIDGEPIGCLEVARLAGLLAATAFSGPRILVVHSLLGFTAGAVLDLAAAFGPERAFCWHHDYSLLCPGFNLLRNDATFCHAPPPGSLGCRICVYGARRERHLQAVARILDGIAFTRVAPSQIAADLAGAPGATVVHPHWTLRRVTRDGGKAARPAQSYAFVGHAFPSKGWPAFQWLVDHLAERPGVRFLHFAAEDTAPIPGVGFVRTRVTAASRDATVTALRAAQVDVVLLLSPWPETFSFVAHEAVVAGCLVFCLETSGNVAALVRETGRGAVFASEAALAAFIESGAARTLIERCAADGRGFEIQDTGTTATLLPALPAPA